MGWDPHRRWMTEGPLCRQLGSELFFPPAPADYRQAPSMRQRALAEEAKAACRACPVLAQCRRDTLGETHGIWAGLDQYQRYLIRRELPRAARRWPPGRRLAWGRIIAGLRPGDENEELTWTEVTRMTGVPGTLARELRREYLAQLRPERRRSRRAQPDRKLMSRPSWPTGAGKRSAWALWGGTICDAHYVAQTSDAAWIQVRVETGRHDTITWLPAGDVHIYRPQPVIIKEKPGYEAAA